MKFFRITAVNFSPYLLIIQKLLIKLDWKIQALTVSSHSSVHSNRELLSSQIVQFEIRKHHDY